MVICTDCHTAASLLKLWLRELYEPLVPDDFYDDAVNFSTRLESFGKDASAERDAALQKLLHLVPTLSNFFLRG